MIRRLALMVGGAVTAMTAAATAFWAARRAGRSSGPARKGGRGRGAGKGRRGAGGGRRGAAQPSVSGPGSRTNGDRDGQPAAAASSAGADAAGTATAATTSAEGLRSIKGIGSVSEERLRELGVTTVAQVAAWTDADVEAFAARIKVSAERIRREDWVGQAQAAAAEG